MPLRFPLSRLWLPLLAIVITAAQGARAATLEQIHTRTDGVEATVDGTRLRVLFVTDRIVRISATPNATWSARASMMRVPVSAKGSWASD